jgi:hypothetical protein
MQNNYEIYPNCFYLATYIDDINQKCKNGKDYYWGTRSDTDGYDVILTAETCKKPDEKDGEGDLGISVSVSFKKGGK